MRVPTRVTIDGDECFREELKNNANHPYWWVNRDRSKAVYENELGTYWKNEGTVRFYYKSNRGF